MVPVSPPYDAGIFELRLLDKLLVSAVLNDSGTPGTPCTKPVMSVNAFSSVVVGAARVAVVPQCTSVTPGGLTLAIFVLRFLRLRLFD